FFQAEDGIRDRNVTGVQTCALPICATLRFSLHQNFGEDFLLGRFRLCVTTNDDALDFGIPEPVVQAARAPAGQRKLEQASAILRSEERRVGKEWISQRWCGK